MADRRPTEFLIGEWLIEPDAGRVSRNGDTRTLRPREMDLLVYLAGRPGQVVPTDDIMRNVWAGVEVTNDSLYFSVSQLRKTLDGGEAGSLIETIPKRGYRLTAPVEPVGPAAETSESPDPATDTVTGEAGKEHPRRLLRFGLAAAVVAVGVFWFVQGGDNITSVVGDDVDAVTIPGQNSIAVMPFIDLTPETDYTYFSDGITEEILNRLTRVPGLRVAARTSSFTFKDSPADVVEIGRALGVSNVLEGSVRKEGNRVRIAVQLIDAATGFQLWSDSFDRQLTSVFEIQDEISRRISDALQITLASGTGGSKADAPLSPAALDEYLMGLEGYRVSSFDSLRDAAGRFRTVLDLEPGFHAARIQLAATLAQITNTGASSDPGLIDEAESHILAALDARPDDAQAHRVYGIVLKWQKRGEESRRQFLRALELAPSDSESLVHLAQAQAVSGDLVSARRLLDRAMRIDPFSVKLLHSYAWIERQFGAVDNARSALERAVAVHPDNPNPWWMLGEILISEYGKIADGLNLFIQAAKRDPLDYEIAAYVAAAYISLDQLAEARPWIERAERTGPPDAVTTHAVRSIYAWVAGDAELALSASRSGIEHRDTRFFARALLTAAMLKIYSTTSVERGVASAAADYLRAEQQANDKVAGQYASADGDLGGLMQTSDLPRRWMLETAIALEADGRRDEARTLTRNLDAARIDELSGFRERLRSHDYMFEAELLALEGDADRAFTMLDEAVAGDLLFLWQLSYRDNAAFAALRSDPRWGDLMVRIQGRIEAEQDRASQALGMLVPEV